MTGVCSTLEWLRPHDFHFVEFFSLPFSRDCICHDFLAKGPISQRSLAWECMVNTIITCLTASVGELSGIHNFSDFLLASPFSNFNFTCFSCSRQVKVLCTILWWIFSFQKSLRANFSRTKPRKPENFRQIHTANGFLSYSPNPTTKTNDCTYPRRAEALTMLYADDLTLMQS